MKKLAGRFQQHEQPRSELQREQHSSDKTLGSFVARILGQYCSESRSLGIEVNRLDDKSHLLNTSRNRAGLCNDEKP